MEYLENCQNVDAVYKNQGFPYQYMHVLLARKLNEQQKNKNKQQMQVRGRWTNFMMTKRAYTVKLRV